MKSNKKKIEQQKQWKKRNTGEWKKLTTQIIYQNICCYHTLEKKTFRSGIFKCSSKTNTFQPYTHSASQSVSQFDFIRASTHIIQLSIWSSWEPYQILNNFIRTFRAVYMRCIYMYNTYCIIKTAFHEKSFHTHGYIISLCSMNIFYSWPFWW